MPRNFQDEAGTQWVVRASLGANVDRRANSTGPIAPGLWFYGMNGETRYLMLTPPSLPMDDELGRMQEWELVGLLQRGRLLSPEEAGRGPRREVWVRATAPAPDPTTAASSASASSIAKPAPPREGAVPAESEEPAEPGSPVDRIRRTGSLADLTALVATLLREFPDGLPDDLGLAIARRRHALDLESRR